MVLVLEVLVGDLTMVIIFLRFWGAFYWFFWVVRGGGFWVGRWRGFVGGVFLGGGGAGGN